jgi:hypothetical protein
VAFRKYLRFVWDNKVFQFRALPLRRDRNKILDPGKKLEPVLLLPSATEQTLPLTDVDVCEDPKRLKREWETLTEVATV